MSLHLSSVEQDPSESTVDRLSSLPGEVLSHILGKMSFKCAVRTSVLAKVWKRKWLSLSQFVLTPDDITAVLDNEDLLWDLLASITNKFLLLHTRPIKTFFLRTCFDSHYPEFCQWIQYLSKQNVEVLWFEECGRQPPKVPLHLLSFETLRGLILTNFVLQIPSNFGQFNILLELSLSRVTIKDDDLELLIRSCPLLDRLILLKIYGLYHLRIHARRLSRLVVDTRYVNLVINYAPCLSTVAIAPAFREPGEMIYLNQRSIIQCLSGLGFLEHLSLSGDFIELLAADSVLEYWPLKNNTLTTLLLHGVKFERLEVFKLFLSILINCPNIKHFYFYIESAKGPNLVTDFVKDNRGRFLFPELRALKMVCPRTTGMGCALNFLEFLSTYSPNLEYLHIHQEGEMNDDRVPQMLMCLKSRCPRVSVQYTVVDKFNSLNVI